MICCAHSNDNEFSSEEDDKVVSGCQQKSETSARHLLPTSEDGKAHNEPEDEEDLPLAELPQGSCQIPTKDVFLPDLYWIPKHSKVKAPHGPIIMAVFDWRRPAMAHLHDHAASLTPPLSKMEAIERGGSI